jgi:CHAT domain-containing protein
VQAAREEEEQAERTLGEVSSRFRELRRREGAGFAEVHDALPPRSALVAFIQFHNGSTSVPVSMETGESTAGAVKAYAALVMNSGAESPRVISLGPIEPIDSLVRRWRNAVSLEPADAGEADATLALGRELRRLIWDPLEKEFAGADAAFVVPEGALNLVNFAALPTEGDRYLLETGPLLHYLSAERDLLLSDHAPARGNELLALGGPDFDAGGGAGGGTPLLLASLLRGPTSECGDFRSLRFKPLPNALAEVEEVASLWTATTPGKSVVRLTGRDASEGAFKRQAPGKRVLHLATHGFFLDDRCQSTLSSAQAGSRDGTSLAEEAPNGETPLVLSGLALAGANRRDDPAEDQEKEDGILTAAEVASLDLRGVEWAVLSACGTGVGPVQTGEGVLGLRRAFQVAGAQTIIMSLWEVGDLPAREWIHQLYLGKLSGLTTAQSVRRAGLEILGARRKANVTTHPYYWGAFIASGDWH